MTRKSEVTKGWLLVERHGLWWAYEGGLPPPEAFKLTVAHVAYRFSDRTLPARSRRRCCGGIWTGDAAED